jgi:hypothetical protein
LAQATAALGDRWRSSGDMAGAGASSITFWLRRCSEQSRSKQVHDVAVAVAEHLHLDVARAGDHLLEQDARVAKACSASRGRSPAGSEIGLALERGACRAAAAGALP